MKHMRISHIINLKLKYPENDWDNSTVHECFKWNEKKLV